jgi:hypothetical protein
MQLLQERFKTRELDWANSSSNVHDDDEDDPENDLLLHQTGTMIEGNKGKKAPYKVSILYMYTYIHICINIYVYA